MPVLLAVLLLLSAPGNQITWSGALPGEVARAAANGKVRSERLQRGGGECILVGGDGGIAAYALDSLALRRIGFVPLPKLPERWSVARQWDLHDVDADSVHELVVARGNSLWQFRWFDSAFGLVRSVSLPAPGSWIVDFVFGDVDRDGADEALVVAADRRPAGGDDSPGTHRLLVCRPAGDSLNVVWTDCGAFGLECASSVVPPSTLLGIWDVCNIGRPELLYEGTESSVGPCTYETYEWRNAELVLARRFRLDEDCLFAPGVPDSERFWFVTGASPAVANGRTRLEVRSVGDGLYSGDRTAWIQQIELHGDTVISAATLLSGKEEHVPRCTLDPDGRGPGVLEFVGGVEEAMRFEFRR